MTKIALAVDSEPPGYIYLGTLIYTLSHVYMDNYRLVKIFFNKVFTKKISEVLLKTDNFKPDLLKQSLIKQECFG